MPAVVVLFFVGSNVFVLRLHMSLKVGRPEAKANRILVETTGSSLCCHMRKHVDRTACQADCLVVVACSRILTGRKCFPPLFLCYETCLTN